MVPTTVESIPVVNEVTGLASNTAIGHLLTRRRRDANMEKSLEALLSEKKKTTVAPDVQQKKQDWITRVDDLYEKIDSWLRPLQARDYLKLGYKRISITEELLGTYDIRKMVIQFFNNRVIELIPTGLYVVGANGRIDVVFDSLEEDFKIIGKSGAPGWEIAHGFETHFVPSAGMTQEELRKREFDIGWHIEEVRGRYNVVTLTKETFEELITHFVGRF